MSKVPSPEERPELYDGYDCQGPSNPASESYWERVMPPELKKLREERQSKGNNVQQAAE